MRTLGLPICLAAVAALAAGTACVSAAPAAGGKRTVWLCRPGQAGDPCTSSLVATVVRATGRSMRFTFSPRTQRFDCFYVYPTVSAEPTANSDLRVGAEERAVATAQASRFSPECRVYAPMYRQVTLATIARHPALDIPASAENVAYASLAAGFRDYLARFNAGRPIVFVGHSQGALLLIRLLRRVVGDRPSLRRRLVLAILLGGGVEVKRGALTGGSFRRLPLCSRPAEAGCVIAYSSFPGEPPATALFGRPAQGVDRIGEPARGVQVACVNPAALGGGKALLDSYFPSNGRVPTPWAELPGLYSAECRSAGGATWLQVAKATGPSDTRPVVSETAGPDWGYHIDDVNLALGNLVADVGAAERTWARTH
jgi:hypothetical protein